MTMSYWGEYTGELKLSRKLTVIEVDYLQAFFDSRRMTRSVLALESLPDPLREVVGLPIGPDGSYYVGSTFPEDHDPSVINENVPPGGQPGLWRDFDVSDDGGSLISGDTDHLNPERHTEWITYLIVNFLSPWGIHLSGTLSWQGEDYLDTGVIVVEEDSAWATRGILMYGLDGTPRRLRVFLCHASEDKPRVRRLKKTTGDSRR
ncbi:MAG TPA: hypothetical protein VER79_12760 [Candidatus Limnocylindrales bacterium]|nr:hypothetical protein [Candidatus Limnocylindrales bacterium]